MYFRRKKSPSGEVLQLLESYRNAEGSPRQRVVASLGDANLEREYWPWVAKAVEGRLNGLSEDLLERDYPPSIQDWIDRIVRMADQSAHREQSVPAVETLDGVLVDQVGHEQTAMLGPVLAGRQAWQALGLDECLTSLGFNESQRLTAAAEVINRLIDPKSENALNDWIQSTALPELFGSRIARGGRDRHYRVTDLLLKHRDAIESHLRSRQRSFFSLQRTMCLYDLTNTYFEGQALGNPKARRGHSKHKRNDCPQLVVGMIFDEYGFAMSHRIYAGNQIDSPTLADMIASLKVSLSEDADCQNDEMKPLVIMDSGLACKKNLQALRAAGMSYLVNDTRATRKNHAEYFEQEDQFTVIHGREKKRPVMIRKIVDQNGDTLLLCKSDGRQEKEQGIRSRAHERLVADLEKLAQRIAKGRLKDLRKIERAIGRILAKHPRAARFYDVKFNPKADAQTCLTWRSRQEEQETDDALLGCYVLRASNHDMAPEEIWNTYMTLSKAEDGFRALKSDLGLRPNRHHTESRADAHIFITILAFHLLRFLLYILESNGDVRRWQTINAILSTHAYTTIVLPTTSSGTMRIRKAGHPDESQKALYRLWDIDWKSLPAIKTIQA